MRSKILYIPNESRDGRERGPRAALSRLLAAGLISDARVFSYRRRLEESGPSIVFRCLEKTVEDFQPTILLIQHPAKTGLLQHHWRRLRELADFKLILHEGDAYDLIRKRPPAELLAAASCSDVAFSVGESRQAAYLRRAGARDVRWVPSVFNADDFGARRIPLDRQFDVVMIANESSSRFPLMSIPGSRSRIKLAGLLERRFGSRFALFGNGWSGSSAMGPIPYLSQEQVVQSAWITANWDHYPNEKKSFSDRLPIALASGTVHVTSSHPGYDELFHKDLGFIYHEDSPEAIVDRATDLIAKNPKAQLTELASIGRAYAHSKFRQDDNIVELINAGGGGISRSEARNAWNLGVPPLDEL